MSPSQGPSCPPLMATDLSEPAQTVTPGAAVLPDAGRAVPARRGQHLLRLVLGVGVERPPGQQVHRIRDGHRRRWLADSWSPSTLVVATKPVSDRLAEHHPAPDEDR